MLPDSFFARPSQEVARALVGKVLRRRFEGVWLAAIVVEAEAYSIEERGSHASLGRTPSRTSLFAPPGTLYFYHSRGGDSMNVSCDGEGNALLVKSAAPWFDARSPEDKTLPVMQRLNPLTGGRVRKVERQCAGQTLLCRSLSLKVREWDGRRFAPDVLFFEDVGYVPERVLVARRLGIPEGRDEHLLWRFADLARERSATAPPLVKRSWREGQDYLILHPGDALPETDGLAPRA